MGKTRRHKSASKALRRGAFGEALTQIFFIRQEARALVNFCLLKPLMTCFVNLKGCKVGFKLVILNRDELSSTSSNKLIFKKKKHKTKDPKEFSETTLQHHYSATFRAMHCSFFFLGNIFILLVFFFFLLSLSLSLSNRLATFSSLFFFNLYIYIYIF